MCTSLRKSIGTSPSDFSAKRDCGPFLAALSSFGNSVEIKLRPEADPQDLLREAAARLRITRFELMEPSLEEIFIDTVGKANA